VHPLRRRRPLLGHALHLGRHVVLPLVPDKGHREHGRLGRDDRGAEGVKRGLELSQESHERVEAYQEEGLCPESLHELRNTRNLTVSVVIPMRVFIHLDANDVRFENKIDEIRPTMNTGTNNHRVIIRIHLQIFVLLQEVLDHTFQPLDAGRSLTAAEAFESLSRDRVQSTRASNAALVSDTRARSCLCAIRAPLRDTSRTTSVDATPSLLPGSSLGLLATGLS